MLKKKADPKLKGPISYIDLAKIEQGADVICPHCYHPLKGSSAFGAEADRYGRITRKYFGWCLQCDMGCEVVQFIAESKWHLHRFRYWRKTGEFGVNRADEWVDVEPLPQAPPVLTGPGGDYDQAAELAPYFLNITSHLQAIMNTLSEVVKSVREKSRGDNP